MSARDDRRPLGLWKVTEDTDTEAIADQILAMIEAVEARDGAAPTEEAPTVVPARMLAAAHDAVEDDLRRATTDVERQLAAAPLVVLGGEDAFYAERGFDPVTLLPVEPTARTEETETTDRPSPS